MSESNSLKKVFNGERVFPPPIWLMRQAGRYLPEYQAVRKKAGSFLRLCYSPGLAAEVTLQPITRFGFDAAIIFADILLVPDALGQKVSFEEGKGPLLDPIREGADLNQLSHENFDKKLEATYETIQRVREKLSDSVALIGFAGAPWTVACYMVEGGVSRDFSKVRSWAYQDPKTFCQLIDILSMSTAAYLKKQIMSGADVIQLFDTWAGVLSETEFEKWCVQPAKRIIEEIRKECGKVPIIGFPRGVGASAIRYATETGVNGIGLDQGVQIEWAASQLPSNLVIQGNLDPMSLRVGGEQLEREVERITRGLAGNSHIFNLGHGIYPSTPIGNVHKLVAAVKNTTL